VGLSGLTRPGKPWFKTLQASGLKSTEEYGCDSNSAATAFVIMYPWVCNGPWNADWSDYWGTDANWQNGLPFGEQTYGVNCYYDNEPFDIVNKGGGYDPHTQSEMVPPQLQVYKFVKQNSDDAYIQGWLIGKKDSSDAEFQDTSGGDDGFWLKALPEGPPY